MTPQELKLIAYHQHIEIRPKTYIPALSLLEKDYGPFFLHEPIQVPVHVALFFRKANLCEIIRPFFLESDYLMTIKKKEEESNEYQEIYPYIFELCDDLLENYEDSENIRLLINDIRQLRLTKTTNGLKSIDGKALNLNNLTVFEYEQVKELLLGSMEMALRMEKGNV